MASSGESRGLLLYPQHDIEFPFTLAQPGVSWERLLILLDLTMVTRLRGMISA